MPDNKYTFDPDNSQKNIGITANKQFKNIKLESFEKVELHADYSYNDAAAPFFEYDKKVADKFRYIIDEIINLTDFAEEEFEHIIARSAQNEFRDILSKFTEEEQKEIWQFMPDELPDKYKVIFEGMSVDEYRRFIIYAAPLDNQNDALEGMSAEDYKRYIDLSNKAEKFINQTYDCQENIIKIQSSLIQGIADIEKQEKQGINISALHLGVQQMLNELLDLSSCGIKLKGISGEIQNLLAKANPSIKKIFMKREKEGEIGYLKMQEESQKYKNSQSAMHAGKAARAQKRAISLKPYFENILTLVGNGEKQDAAIEEAYSTLLNDDKINIAKLTFRGKFFHYKKSRIDDK